MARKAPQNASPPATEGFNPHSEDLDLCAPGEVARRLHEEDLLAVAAVGDVLPQISEAARLIAEALRGGGRLLYVGAGTSGRLGTLDAAECPPTFGTDPRQVQAVIAGGRKALTRAVEGAEDDSDEGARAMAARRVSDKDVVCGISASATTPFVLGALEAARRRGAPTVLVCCNPKAKGSGAADVIIAPHTGAELIAGSTRLKAGTATKLILNALSTAAMVSLGKVFRGRMVDVKPLNRKLRARAERMVAELAELPLDEARALLAEAKGQVKVALAMHFGGLRRSEAIRALAARSLRELAESAPPRPPAKRRAR